MAESGGRSAGGKEAGWETCVRRGVESGKYVPRLLVLMESLRQLEPKVNSLLVRFTQWLRWRFRCD